MEKYSCSYANTKGNFVIQNIEAMADKEYDSMYDELFGVYCIVQNIIQRGIVTKPSQILENELGKIKINTIEKIPLIKDNNPNWINTIKGDDLALDYPAKIFYDEIYPDYMHEYSFTKQLILPEAKISDILEKSKKEFEKNYVDFYLPEAKMVIEIDGGSHCKDSQFRKDRVRDEALTKEGIRVFRIPTYDIKNHTDNLKMIMNEIFVYVTKCDEIQKYKTVLSEETEVYSIHKKYDIVIRFQILILTCLKHGRLKSIDEQWQINIIESDFEGTDSLLELAYRDIANWIKIITKLMKINFEIPKLVITLGVDSIGINVDFSIYKRWTDENRFNYNCVFVRNDYYEHKNYFRMATADSKEYKIIVEGPGSDLPALKYLLFNLFGFKEFREGQLPIIINILERKDTIGILPTGSGKSLCYQFAAILQPGVSIVVAPIISLMIDQKDNMDKIGMTRTEYIASNLSASQKESVLDKFKEGQYELIWMSPERFQNKEFRRSLSELNRKMNFALAVIDEVHCLSEWGHDFRTSYLTLTRTIKEFCPESCLLGLTATASQAVLEDLKNEFEIDGTNVKALASMDRDELIFFRKQADSGNRKFDLIEDIFLELEKYYGQNVLEIYGEESKCGLVFTPTKTGRNGCKDFADDFSRHYNRRIGQYHADLSSKERRIVQKEFMDNKYNILACTKAFGMGINKKNINYTIHYGIPQSIESFYQEAGRAGRDENKEKKSFCYILIQPEVCDEEVIEKIFSANISIETRKKLCIEELKNDLGTIMHLWNLNRYSVDEEYRIIRNVLEMLFRNAHIIQFDNSNKSNTELALYKLSILGIVKDWTIEYYSLEKGEFDVEYAGCEEESIREMLLRYIRKYEPEFRLDIQNRKNEKYIELLNNNEKPITSYIKILLTWGNDNILYQRLTSTKNMFQLCDKSISDKSFRRTLEYYFRYSEVTIYLDEISYNPKKYELWFEVLYEQNGINSINDEKQIITREKAENILASLSRYIESYQNNTGLNFLYGLLQLFSNKYSRNDGGERLRSAFESILEMEWEQANEIIDSTLSIGKAMDEPSKLLLSEMICDHFLDKSRKVFNTLQDEYSLCIELEKNLTKLRDIRGGCEWVH